MHLIPILLLLTILLLSCESTEQRNAASGNALDWVVLADRLLDQMDLQPTEEVLLVAEPGRFDPLVPLLEAGIEAADAIYLGTVSTSDTWPESWQSTYILGMEGLDSTDLLAYLHQVDLGVMMPGPSPEDRIYHLMQNSLREGHGRTIHFHWSGAYDLNGNPIPVDTDVDLFYQRALLQTDYAALAERQRAFERAIRGQTIRVTTPAGTDLSFSIGDRPVTRQDGDASAERMHSARNLIDREVELPAGAIRVAPIEETVNGTIAFPDGQWNDHPVTGLSLSFESGRVIGIEAEAGQEHVQAEMAAAGPAGKAFREFALGFNPLLAIPEADPWIPYYGYGAGVVRLSLGDNTELGGKVGGGYVRWNFFPDATVRVGEEVWVEDGKLVR